MKQYKLIKEYPGSPKLGTKVNETNQTWYEGNFNIRISNSYIENSPEYWQEIKERDYQILKYKSITGSILNSLSNLDEYFFDNSTWYIYSIKRLSDGQIFTIGDKLSTKNWGNSYEGCILTHFNINSYIQLGFEVVSDGIRSIAWYINLEDFYIIPPVKKKLFTTEDGIDIYDGDEVYLVKLRDFTLFKVNIDNYELPNDNFLYFSDKNSAKEYIIMNKPCLCFNDLLHLKGIFTEDIKLDQSVLVGIRKLVESKL